MGTRAYPIRNSFIAERCLSADPEVKREAVSGPQAGTRLEPRTQPMSPSHQRPDSCRNALACRSLVSSANRVRTLCWRLATLSDIRRTFSGISLVGGIVAYCSSRNRNNGHRNGA